MDNLFSIFLLLFFKKKILWLGTYYIQVNYWVCGISKPLVIGLGNFYLLYKDNRTPISHDYELTLYEKSSFLNLCHQKWKDQEKFKVSEYNVYDRANKSQAMTAHLRNGIPWCPTESWGGSINTVINKNLWELNIWYLTAVQN